MTARGLELGSALAFQRAMRVSYAEDYFVPLPPRHPFPMGKFPALHAILLEEHLVTPDEVVKPREADWGDLLLAHGKSYLSKLRTGTLDKHEQRRMGLPWSERLVRRSRIAVQGTINAAFMALEDGVAANLAGGTHHAFPGHGEGFCVLNDVAVAIRVLERSRWIRRAMVVDLDVHQGNGTAAALAGDGCVVTLSIHGERNFPWNKIPSTVDIGLPDGTSDDEYLDVLKRALAPLIERSMPDIIFYLAGVDVLADDRFGRLAMSRRGLHERERLVLETISRAGVPCVLLLSGGYAATPELTADLHAVVHREAATVLAV